MLGWRLFGLREVREQGDRVLFPKHKPRKKLVGCQGGNVLGEQFGLIDCLWSM
jgi:hypothetical protein